MVLVRLLEAVHVVIELLNLVLGLVDLRGAILLLRIVVDLLFSEESHHVIDHLDHFLEANAAGLELQT